MSIELIETDTHVFELTCDPGVETPGRVKRMLSIRLVSGQPLTDDQWVRIKQFVVRDLIDRGCQVFRTGVLTDGDEQPK